MSVNVFADVKIKSRQTMQGQTSEKTIYIKSKRQRPEMARGALTTILQCDLRRDLQLMPPAPFVVNPSNTLGAKAKSNGENIISPLVEQTAQAIVRTVTKK